MRIDILDGLRGLFLVMMTSTHLARPLGRPWLLDLDYHRLGYVDAAHGFVLLSGLVIGLVHGPRMLASRAAATRDLHRRAWLVWTWHVGLVAAIGLALWVTGTDGEAFRWGDDLALTGALAMATLTGPRNIDILPLYVLFLALAPLALRQMAQGRVALVAGLSLAVWGLAQTRLPAALMAWATQATGLGAQGIELGLVFDRTAWQVLFFAGLVLGFLWARGLMDLSVLRHGPYVALFAAALAVCAVFAGLRLAQYAGDLPETVYNALPVALDRTTLSGAALTNLAADVYVLTWLLAAGVVARGWWLRWPALALRRCLTLPPLTFLGRHALPVFGWHVAMVHALAILGGEALYDLPENTRTAILVLCCLTLFVPAAISAAVTGPRRPVAARGTGGAA